MRGFVFFDVLKVEIALRNLAHHQTSVTLFYQTSHNYMFFLQKYAYINIIMCNFAPELTKHTSKYHINLIYTQMKKLLLIFALAAAGLQGWADDFYIVGDATLDGWQGTRTCKMAETSSGSNIYTWTGYLKATSGDTNGFKICNGSSWSAWCASSNQKPIGTGTTEDTPQYYNDDVNPKTGSDNKWKVNTNGYYELKLDLAASTKKFTAKLLVKANASGTCLIENATDLTEFRKLVNDKGMTSLNAELTADITLTGNHTPIGTSTNKYAGTFDGKGNVIKNLSLSATSGSGVGFFGYTNGATIQDVEFLKANVNVTGGNNTGIVVGICDGGTTIQRCAVVNSYLKGSDHTGSIAGCAKGNSIIKNCYSNAKVVSGSQAAGMVGTSEGMTIEHCLFMGPRIESSGGYGARGLISLLEGSNDNQTYMKNNLVAAQYVLSNGKRHGVLTYIDNGTLHPENNYSLSTTLYGPASNPATESHTNKDDINGAQVAPNNVNQAFFSTTLGFDLTNTWKMVEDLTYAGGSYPILKWMTAPETSVGISSAEDLFDFCTFLWDNQDATLSSDVTYSATVYQGQDAMIGTGPNPYKGTFDGQNHTVTIGFNNTNAEYTGLFCQVNGGTIKNLKVAGDITTDKKFAGGICAKVNRKATITNCESNVTITDSRTTEVDGTHGGIVALISSHGDGVEISNCLFSGAISASTVDGCGGVVGWTSGGSSNVTIKNCLITGKMTVRTTGANDIIARNGAKESGNYYVGSFTGISNAESATSATDTQKTSGELCYLLNGSTQGGTNWTQTIGTDDYPVPFNTQRLVYLNNSTTYANNYIKDGKYQISNASELVDFSALVNDGNASLDAELTADIDMSSVTEWTPIGQHLKDYAGHFNGQGHRIKNLKIDNGYENQALLGQAIHPAIIENVIIDSSCSIKGKKWAAGILGHVWGDGVIIRNCGNEADITGTENTCAGILGCSDGKIVQIYNCYNTGDISSPTWNAGICGWMGNTNSIIKNCYSTGSVSGTESAPIWRYNDGLNTGNEENIWTTSDGQGSKITGTMLTDGTLCAKLGFAFRQNIGEGGDAHPNFDKTHGFVAQISAAGYTTMYNIYSDVTIPDGIEAFAGKVNDKTVTLLPIEGSIAASEPVILRGNAGLYNFMPTSDVSKAASNSLKGSDGNVTGGDGIYALAKKGATGEEVVGFYPVGDGVKIPEGKAYLEYTGSNPVKGFTFVFDEDDATGISLMEDGRSQMEDGAIYNIAGQRINKMQRGINIVNGKKILK